MAGLALWRFPVVRLHDVGYDSNVLSVRVYPQELRQEPSLGAYRRAKYDHSLQSCVSEVGQPLAESPVSYRGCSPRRCPVIRSCNPLSKRVGRNVADWSVNCEKSRPVREYFIDHANILWFFHENIFALLLHLILIRRNEISLQNL